MERLRVALVGAGAVGGYFAAPLAAAGHEVGVVARGATLDALRRRGTLELRTRDKLYSGPVRAVSDARELGPQDLVLMAVKAPALPSAAAHVPPLLQQATIVLPLLNGIPWWFFEGEQRLRLLDPDGTLARDVPARHIVGSVVFPSISSPEPGVSQLGGGTRVVFGEPGGGDSARVQRVVAFFQQAGLSPEASTDIRREVWLKLLGNACFNPASLLTGSHTDDMIDDPLVHRLFVGMMQELIAVGRGLGLSIDIDPKDRIAFTRKSAGHIKTSMLQDVEAGRAVELDGILGAAIEAAQRTGVPAPLLETVYALARRRSRELGLYPQPATP